MAEGPLSDQFCLSFVSQKIRATTTVPASYSSVRKKCSGPVRWIPPTAVSLLWEDFFNLGHK